MAALALGWGMAEKALDREHPGGKRDEGSRSPALLFLFLKGVGVDAGLDLHVQLLTLLPATLPQAHEAPLL